MEKICRRISEIGTVVGGGTPSTKNPDYWGGDIPWISPKDLTDYKSVYISKGENFLTEKGLKSGTRLLPKNTLLFSSRAPIGYVALAANPICTNQGFKSIVCDEKQVVPLYLYYYMKANLDYIKLFGTGATFPEISGKTMGKIKVEIFKSLDVQHRIASILSTYDSLIENNAKRIRLLEKMAENLYKEWFVRFRFPGHENVEMENGLPKGWKRGSLSDVCEFKRGKNITSSEMQEGNVPVISAGLEPSGYHSCSNVRGVNVTMSSSGANAGYIAIHYSDIWAADCSYIEESTTGNIYYVYELLNNIRTVINNFQRGAAQPHVYPKDVNRIKLILPSKELMLKANGRLEIMHKEIYNLQKQNSLLARQRDLLLPRLMSGKLEVKEELLE
ncbi:MAG: restriction endonuclease subunit S [Prevotella sp.]|nr:restriction endonuclease subunit S [Prevotella sp.]